MNEKNAIYALSALAQEHRLRVFRLLVREIPAGLAAGEIAERIGLAPSALSFHLSHLERSGLLQATRNKRNIIYTVETEGMRRLLAFLSEDCCHGRPEICGGLPSHAETMEA